MSLTTEVIIGISIDGKTPFIISNISSGDIGRYFNKLINRIINGTKLRIRKKHDCAA